MKTHLVCLSGGPVSTTLLAEVVNRVGADHVHAFSLVETKEQCAHVRRVAKAYQVSLLLYKSGTLGGDSLPPSLTLLLPLAFTAAGKVSAATVWTGHTLADEAARGARRPEFVDAMQFACRLAVEGWITHEMPWSSVTRPQALLCAARLEVPASLLSLEDS